MVELQVSGGEDFEPMELRVTAPTLAELQPFLRMADHTGIPVRMVPAVHEHLPNSCTLHFNLAYVRDVERLATIVLASVTLASGTKKLDRIRDDAATLALRVT